MDQVFEGIFAQAKSSPQNGSDEIDLHPDPIQSEAEMDLLDAFDRERREAESEERSTPNFVLANMTNDNIPEVLTKHIETVPERYVNRQVKMLNVSFSSLSEVWLRSLPGIKVEPNGRVVKLTKRNPENWFGFHVSDRQDNFFQFLFASKAEFVDRFLEFNKDEKLSLIGTVITLDDTRHALIVTHVYKH